MTKYLAALVTILAAFSVLRAQTAPPAASARAATAPAAKIVALPASLEAFESADLYAKDSGYVAEVRVDIGDHVRQGQLLAAIDDPELLKQVASAQATVDARQEMVKAGEAIVLQSQSAADVAASQMVSVQAELALAQATRRRQEQITGQGAISDQERDEVQTRAKVAQAQLDVATARVAAAQSDVAVAKANLAVSRTQVMVADAELHRLETLLQYTKVIAPFDGVITRRFVNRGDLVQTGVTNRSTPLFNCQRIDTIRIFCDVPEASAPGVTPGVGVSVKVFALDSQVIPASVTRVATSLSAATRTMRAEIDLPNPDEKLRPGMYAQVTLTLPTR